MNIVKVTLGRIQAADERPLSVTEIAKAAAVSVFHLTHSFAEITGKLPARDLAELTTMKVSARIKGAPQTRRH
jgi:transcriptional regulator GlxA family with amidase domain